MYNNRVWNSMGPWHLCKEGFSTICKLFDEVFYRDLISTFRGEGKANKGRQEWHMQAKGMRQCESEMFQMGMAFYAAAVREICLLKACSASQVTQIQVDQHILLRAEECPLAFLILAWMRLRNAVYGIVDSKNDGPVGNFSLYLELLPVLQKVFSVTNATSYVLLVNAEIERWLVASENERAVHAHRGYVKQSESGFSHLWGDEAGEHVQGCMRNYLGHHYRTGKEHQIARVGWHLERLSQAATRQRQGGRVVPKGGPGEAPSGSDRDKQIRLEHAFWGPYKLFLARGILKLGGDIQVGGYEGDRGSKRWVSAASLVALSGQPLSSTFVEIFDVIEERCAVMASKHVLGEKHGISVKRVPFNAKAAHADALEIWNRHHSTDPKFLLTLTKSYKGDCLVELKKNWLLLAPGTTSPSLSQKMQHDGGVDTLNQMQIGQLRGTHKTKLFNEECQAELLASARIAVQKHTAAPQRPMPGAVIDKAMDHGTLRRQLQRHTLFRPLGSPGITPVHAWASENASRIAEAELAEVEASRGGGLASSGKETVAEDVPSSSVPNVPVAAVTVTGQPDEVSGHVSKRQKQTLSSNEGCSSVHGGVAGQGIQARQDEFIEPSHAKRPIADADGQEAAPSKKKKLNKDCVTPNVSRSGRTTGSWKQPREW